MGDVPSSACYVAWRAYCVTHTADGVRAHKQGRAYPMLVVVETGFPLIHNKEHLWISGNPVSTLGR